METILFKGSKFLVCTFFKFFLVKLKGQSIFISILHIDSLCSFFTSRIISYVLTWTVQRALTQTTEGNRLIWYLAFPPVTVLMRITVTLCRIVPRHLILQRIVLLIFPKSEPAQLQTIYATGWKIIKDIIWEIVIRGNAHMLIMLQFISGRTINQYLKLVYLRK